MTSWNELLTRLLELNHETWADVEASTFTGSQLTVEFDAAEYGHHGGCAFTLWTKNNVYFPTTYDGEEGVACVPRNPCDIATRHIGYE